MSNLSGTIKSIQNIMRKDAGVDGDAQRISQLVWLIFLKIFDDKEKDLEVEAMLEQNFAKSRLATAAEYTEAPFRFRLAVRAEFLSDLDAFEGRLREEMAGLRHEFEDVLAELATLRENEGRLEDAVALLEREIAALVAGYAPQLLEEAGCGPLTAAKLIGEIAKLKGRPKDDDFKASLAEESTPSLWDRYQSVQSSSSGKSGSN